MIYTVTCKTLAGTEVFEPEQFTDLNDAVASASAWNIFRSPAVEVVVTDEAGTEHFRRTISN